MQFRRLSEYKFTWQRGYGANSVSASQLDVVKKLYQKSGLTSLTSTFNGDY